MTGERIPIPTHGIIFLDAARPQAVRFSALGMQSALRRAGYSWEISAAPVDRPHLSLRLRPDSAIPDQGYQLSIASGEIEVVASSEAGLFYGTTTLAQLIDYYCHKLPLVEVEDHPDFPVRGLMLDVSRDRVPTMESLFALVDRLAGWKINQLQLYTEHTFAYRRHPEV